MKKWHLFLLLFQQFIFGQGAIEWGEIQPSKGKTYSILALNKEDFISVNFKKTFVFSSDRIRYYSQLTPISEGKILTSIGNQRAKIVHIDVLNETPVVFLSYYSQGKNILFLQKYSKMCVPLGPAVELLSYTLPKTWGSKGDFKVLFSENKDFFCAEYNVPGQTNTNEHLGYKIFKKDLTPVLNGNYTVPYSKEIAFIDKRLLTDKGDYFITTKIFSENTNRSFFFGDQSNLDRIICHQIVNDSTYPFTLPLSDQRIFDLKIDTDNSNLLTISALTGNKDKNDNGIKGVYHATIEIQTKKIISQGKSEFDISFITQDWTERAKKRALERAEKGKGAPELYDYELREMYPLKDGSIIGVLEQFFVQNLTYSDPRTGMIYTRYVYNYDDLITFKIAPDNTFKWIKKIPKIQTSVNDHGYYSSISTIKGDSTLQLFFNDDVSNYSETGDWEEGKQREINYSKRSNVLAKLNIDLESGTSTRKSILNGKKEKSIAVPKLFFNNKINSNLILYLNYGSKEKFGFLRY
jgi:hypothetical protein